MTDARLPERYLMDRRIIRLSDADFRSFVMAMLWSVSNRTDGEVATDDLALIPGFVGTAATSLEIAGLWTSHGDGWTITDYDNTQTSRHDLEVLDNARRADREKKRRQRADRKGDGPSFSASPGDVPGDMSRGTTQDRTGQARQGQAEYLEPSGLDQTETVNHQTGEVSEPAPRYEYVQENGKTLRRPVAA